MQIPPLSTSPDGVIRFGVALAAALEADPETTMLAGPMRAANERVRAAGTARTAAREAAVASLALRNRADFEADRIVRRLDAEALLLADRNRGRSPYRELFPEGVSAVVAAPIPEEIELIKTLEGRVAAIPALAKYGPDLAKAREKVEKALAVHTAATRTETEASADVELAKSDWQRQYRAVYGSLLTQFGDKAQAESFFLSPRRSRAADDDEDTPATT